ncbi:acyl-CoA dehydrogenase family protein [Paracoccus sp. DMF-8]|uniref:acyl-CoA dehydrogenase family protein n=1 Tax=Paracoccus sp. DMF-8 TaxID=3019445 RepID=UPI0023E7B159|nr:acyl-CoA dehydrogenase family protein [Paracoccus sp. DMF-8]MDF3606616.1 acyl-CoA dehydrogenase family protein [Paracoccus sp. DMF-8]
MHLHWNEARAAIRAEYAHIGQPEPGEPPPGTFDRRRWDQLAQAGLWRMVVPPEHGGRGVDCRSFTAALEGLASTIRHPGLVLSVIGQAGMIRALELYRTETQRRRYLRRVLAGELRATAIADPDTHSGNFGIDPDLLKRVEVAPGAGSALAGPGALGGAIRYETKDPEDLLLPGRSQGYMLKLSAQTNGKRVTPGLAFYGSPDARFGYLVHLTKSWADDYKDGDGNRGADTGNDPLDALVKLRFRPAEGHEPTFSSTWRRDSGRRAYRSNFGIPPDLPDAVPEDQKLGWRSTSVSYRFDPADNPFLDLTVSAYDTHSRLLRDIDVRQVSEWDTRGFDIRNRSDFGQVAVTYGYDYGWTRAAESALTGAERAAMTLDATIAGLEPRLFGGGLVQLAGLRAELDGEWHLKNVTHELSSAGLITSIQATKGRPTQPDPRRHQCPATSSAPFCPTQLPCRRAMFCKIRVPCPSISIRRIRRATMPPCACPATAGPFRSKTLYRCAPARPAAAPRWP